MRASRLPLVVVFIALVAGLTALQWTYGVQSVCLDAESWLSVLHGQGAFIELRDQIVTGIDLSELPGREAAKARQALSDTLRPEWLEAQVGSVLGDVLDFLTGEAPEVTAEIQIGEFKDDFMAAYSATGHFLVVGEVNRRLGDLPDRIAIRSHLEETGLAETAHYFRWLDRAPAILLAGCVALALACLGLGGRRSGLGWVGAACLAGGALSLAAMFVIGRLAHGLLAGLDLTGPAAGFSVLAREVIGSLIAQVFTSIWNGALALGGGGLLLMLAAGVRPRASLPADPTVPPVPPDPPA